MVGSGPTKDVKLFILKILGEGFYTEQGQMKIAWVLLKKNNESLKYSDI
jgi:hypothetical protein